MSVTPKNPIIQKILGLIGNEYGAAKQFAATTGIDYKLLRKNICLNITPSLSTLIAISRAYGVSLDELCKDYKPEVKFKL